MKKMIYRILIIIGIAVLAAIIWNGFTFEIGKKDNGFHMRIEQYPLKRFFKR